MKVVELVKRTWCPPENRAGPEEVTPRSEARAEAHAKASGLLAESTVAHLKHRFAVSALPSAASGGAALDGAKARREPELELRPVHEIRSAILTSSAAAAEPASTTGSGAGELHANILEMSAAMMAIQEKRRPWQLAVVDRVHTVVGLLWPVASPSAPHGAWVEMYGSLATGLDTPSSDIDLVVRGVVIERCYGEGAQAHHQLASALQLEGWDEIKVIENTGVPVIKVTSGGGLISVDISFDGPAHRGLNTATFVSYLVTVHDGLHPLALVLKQLLVERGLNDPYSGGLSSFGLVLLIAFVLHQRRQRNGSDGAENLGEALEEFLRFFGDEFDAERQGISIQKWQVFPLPTSLPADDDGGISAPARDPLTIEDPTNIFNNVGRLCSGVGALQRVFSEALRAVVTAQGSKGGSVLGRMFGQGSHHMKVVELVKRTWCPPEHAPLEPPPAAAAASDAAMKTATEEVQALREDLAKALSDGAEWERRARAAENAVAELSARLAAVDKPASADLRAKHWSVLAEKMGRGQRSLRRPLLAPDA